jgi:hypothetical protein
VNATTTTTTCLHLCKRVSFFISLKWYAMRSRWRRWKKGRIDLLDWFDDDDSSSSAIVSFSKTTTTTISSAGVCDRPTSFGVF